MPKDSKDKKEKKQPRKANKDEYIEVQRDELWLHSDIGKEFYDLDYLRIVDFYVLYSPCKCSNYSPRTLDSLGWVNPWHSSTFRNTFDSESDLVLNDNFLMSDYQNHFKELWDSICNSSFVCEKPKEFAIIIGASEGNPRMDLLHRIRNAFAHGRFTVKRYHKEYYIYFEDVTKVKDLTGLFAMARICLKKSTLINWIDLFEYKNDDSKALSALRKNTV